MGKTELVIAGLFDALQRLASDSELRCRMGQKGRRRITSDFDWDRKGKAMLRL
jgi:glycosyltransferase involved in cell wall biosynthesis